MATEDGSRAPRPTELLEIDDGPLRAKFWKVWPECLVNCGCCMPCNTLLHPCRKAVSRKKLRWEKEGFSLDLVYLWPRVIVMGFPATGVEHVYRNPRREVARFLNTRHPDHYHVFNFCCEAGRGYPSTLFHGAVSRFPFMDHFCPPLQTMIDFGEAAAEHLAADETNVVAVHCKAGKGRAGLMSCVLTVRMGYAESAQAAMDHYDNNRVRNKRGLTVPSQRRWVTYYDRAWTQFRETGAWPVEKRLRVRAVRLTNLYAPQQVRLQVMQGTNFGADLVTSCVGTTSFEPEAADIAGNVFLKITRPTCGLTGRKYKKHVRLWFNTAFLEPGTHTFVKPDCDGVKKDMKRHRKFPSNFAIEVDLEAVEGGDEGGVPATAPAGVSLSVSS